MKGRRHLSTGFCAAAAAPRSIHRFDSKYPSDEEDPHQPLTRSSYALVDFASEQILPSRQFHFDLHLTESDRSILVSSFIERG